MPLSSIKPATYVLSSFKKCVDRDLSFIRYFCEKPGYSVKIRPCMKEENTADILSSTIVCGQPTCFSHPHLISQGEVVPGIKIEEFQKRRNKFMKLIFGDSLSACGIPMHHIVVIPAASKTYMTEKIPYVFHQNTDFLYLSGCLEPDTALVLSGSCENDFVSTMFLRPSDADSVKWDGPRTGIDVAPRLFGVDQACYIEDLPTFLTDCARKNQKFLFYYDLQSSSTSPINPIITDYIRRYNIVSCKSWKRFVDQLRLIKSPAEQNLLKKACSISSAAIQKAMEITKPGITEHQLFATVDYESRMRGAEILAYPPVVASGKNANIIHYINNNQMIREGELILMDAGCEYHSYCGDITRTWPVNGRFTNYQRILYELVLDIQKQIISTCEEKLSIKFMYTKMIHLLGEYLKEERVIKANVYDANAISAIAISLCPHHVGHYLGMDIHDVRTVSKDIHLEPGMVVTVEPGIYVKEHPQVAPEFWNIGIRIEDDILVSDTGYEILSAECPKAVSDIQNIMKK